MNNAEFMPTNSGDKNLSKYTCERQFLIFNSCFTIMFDFSESVESLELDFLLLLLGCSFELFSERSLKKSKAKPVFVLS